MNANDVIESYVTDIALELPRKQRNDVAFELRALLNEELQARAEAEGRGVDAAMATQLVRAFGRPADVATRYRPGLTIIDPADGHAFLRAAGVGLGVIWGVGLLVYMRRPIGSLSEFIIALGQWWGTTLIPSMWWPGLLVVSFAAAAWTRRRWPQATEWNPRPEDRLRGGRVAMVMGLVGMLCGLAVLIEPRWVLQALFGGRLAPAAYDALTYTADFRQHQGPCLLAVLVLNIPTWITAIVNGRWSTAMRRLQNGLDLLTCVILVWTALDGPVFITSASDQLFKAILMLIVVMTLLSLGLKLHRNVAPSPDQRARA